MVNRRICVWRSTYNRKNDVCKEGPNPTNYQKKEKQRPIFTKMVLKRKEEDLKKKNFIKKQVSLCIQQDLPPGLCGKLCL
jgi:hypothetical protein